MQGIVVDDDTVAAECIDYLKKSRAGRATFLPLSKMLVGRPRGKAILVAKESVGFAIDLIKFDEKRREFTTKVTAIREELEAKQKKLSETEKTAARVEEDLARFRKELEALKGQRDARKAAVLEAAPQAVSAQMKELMANRAKAGDDVTAARAKLETLDAQMKVQGERRTEFDQRIEGLVTQRGDHEKRVKEFEASLQKLENEIRGLEKMEAHMSKEMQGPQF